jgi:hypothetical protein
MLEHLDQRFQAEEGEHKAKRLQSGVDGRRDPAFDGLADIRPLARRDFVFVQVGPDVPVAVEYLPEAVVGGGVVGVTPEV